jgi:hypothetical protein
VTTSEESISVFTLGEAWATYRLAPILCGMFRYVTLTIRSGVMVTGYGVDGSGSIHRRSKFFFSTPYCPAGLWSPSWLLSNGHRGINPRG